MPHEAALLDPHLVKVIFLGGLLLGVLGSLFLAYDLLGSQEGPLRKFLRIALPGLLGALAIGPLFLLGLLVVRAAAGALAPGEPVQLDTFQVLFVGPSIGAFLGIMTALFGAPASEATARPTFSFRDARGGFLLALVYVGASDADQSSFESTSVVPLKRSSRGSVIAVDRPNAASAGPAARTRTLRAPPFTTTPTMRV